jgi:ABC-type uncharacterized transport system permease subunit
MELEAFESAIIASLRAALPLICAAMGGLLSERSGVVNISLEGKLIVGAFAGACIAALTNSAWVGFLGGAGAGALLSLLYAVFVIHFKANQIVAGTAINLLAMGFVPFLSKIFYSDTARTPQLPLEARFEFFPYLFVALIVILIKVWMKYSVSGLWVLFAGEKPAALESSGVSVVKVRYFSLLFCGLLAGAGGATLSLFLSSSYTRNMTAGRGFMALAALILGKWRPIPTALACLFFAFADVLQGKLQGVVLFGERPLPVQFVQMLPYVVTLIVLTGFVGRAKPPAALGSS